VRPSGREGETGPVVTLAVPPHPTAQAAIQEGATLRLPTVPIPAGVEARRQESPGLTRKPQLKIVGRSLPPALERRGAASSLQSDGGSGKSNGLKKSRGKGPAAGPPTPWGCEWRRDDQGWNLWRCWTERDEATGKRVPRSRYAGYLSHEAWEVLKGYDYEAFLSIIGQRFRRHGKR